MSNYNQLTPSKDMLIKESPTSTDLSVKQQFRTYFKLLPLL